MSQLVSSNFRLGNLPSLGSTIYTTAAIWPIIAPGAAVGCLLPASSVSSAHGTFVKIAVSLSPLNSLVAPASAIMVAFWVRRPSFIVVDTELYAVNVNASYAMARYPTYALRQYH